MNSILKKVCVGTCGALMIPMVALAPVNAAAVPATSTATTETAEITIPEGTTFKTAIPDENFRKFINETFFGDKVKDDDKFTKEMLTQLQDYTGLLNVSAKKIVNLKGIEYFTGITELDASYNNLQLLDISTLKDLKKVNVAYNDLTQFTYGKDNALTDINCRNNNLTILNLAGVTSMETLDCSNNKLTMLNVAGLYQLTFLDCSDNDLTSLGLDGLVALEKLYCDGNALVTLDVSSLKNLKVLENRRSEITLKVQAVGTNCGVILPAGAATPSNISNSESDYLG